MAGGEGSSSARLVPGRELGKYRLVRRLGKGGGGEVWLAANTFAFPGEEEEVALKVPRRQQADHVRLLAEPKMLKRLAHPHIVRVLSADKSEGTFFVVMEYMGGGTLRDRMRPGKHLPVDSLLPVAREVLEGLAHAHRARVVHRDLKPENILFTEEGVAKIGDFGTARPLEDEGFVAGTGGSRAYKAPEQFESIATTASDVWSMGLVLYEALTGRYPFLPTSDETLEQAIANRPIPRLPSGEGQASRSLLGKCLERDPARRFPDATALLEAVRRADPGGA